jgi:hypothetical protein
VISCASAAVHAEAERLSARHAAEGGKSKHGHLARGDGALDGCKEVSEFRWKSNQTGERGRADSETLRTGETREEFEKEMHDAMGFHLEVLRLEGEKGNRRPLPYTFVIAGMKLRGSN